MSCLRHCTRSLLSSFSSSPICLRRLSSSNHHAAARAILIQKFPPTASINDLLSLKGLGHPVESAFRIKHNNDVEIRYLEADSARYVRTFSGRNAIIYGGQLLDIKLLPPRRLPVEIVAAIGLRAASRMVVIRDTRGLTEEKLREELERRFGETERVWVNENDRRAVVTFSHIHEAIKARKTLQDEGWPVNFRDYLPRPPKHSQTGKFPHYGVVMKGVRASPREVLRELDPILNLRNGDPSRVQTFPQGTLLAFGDSSNADKFTRFYRPPPGVIVDFHPKHAPSLLENAAIKLGACRTLIMDRFKDPSIDFDRLHRDFSVFGDIFYVYLDHEKAQARVVYTNIASALKAMEDIYENLANLKYSIYNGAQITFGQFPNNRGELSPLRPLFIRRQDLEASVGVEGPTGPDNGYDDFQHIDSRPLSTIGEVEWREAWDDATGDTRYDVLPLREGLS
ncbi:hypothetical protein D9758_009205 [Tetrapyrgos nigripes]|uniref:RRM domain-containing protein n=1 Tax=Tetrapyrgos nigripes TaxID=182062 RepID=A0A8H5D208_9AGAR|nr:hypothetical protein D9758_009205 [Tetrapyrgos nigripes]